MCLRILFWALKSWLFRWKVTFCVQNLPKGGKVTNLGQSPKKTFFYVFPTTKGKYGIIDWKKLNGNIELLLLNIEDSHFFGKKKRRLCSFSATNHPEKRKRSLVWELDAYKEAIRSELLPVLKSVAKRKLKPWHS